MKKTIFSTLIVLPLLALSQNAPIEGVNYAGFQKSVSQSCLFLNAAIYLCQETGGDGRILQTQVVDFDSKEELCTKLRMEDLHSVSVAGSSYVVASAVRSKYINANCPVSTVLPEPSKNELITTMVCRLTVEALDGATGDSGFIQFPVARSGSANGIYAVMHKTKVNKTFQLNSTTNSTRYLRVDFRYSKDLKGGSDQLSVDVNLKNGITARVQGQARTGVSLNIDQVGDVAKAEIKCVVPDAEISVNQSSDSDYSCDVADNSMPGNFGVAAPISSLIANSVQLTKPEAATDVSMSAEIPAVLNFKAQLLPSAKSSITGKASLSEPSKFSVSKLGKTVRLNCK